MNNFQNRVKHARMNRGLSQTALAELTGVSQPSVANWERGSHVPRNTILHSIATALGVEEHWLLSGNMGQSARHAQNYLSQPILHIPILPWPHLANETAKGTKAKAADHGSLAVKSALNNALTDAAQPPLGYMPFAGAPGKYQAFLKPVDMAGVTEVLICDLHDLSVKPGGFYLAEIGGKIVMCGAGKLGNKTPLARIVCAQKHYS